MSRKKQIEREKDLHITLDKVKRSDSHVSETTAENSTESTGSIECRRVHLDLARLTWSRNHEVGPGGSDFQIGSRRNGGGGRSRVEHLLERQGFGGGGRGVEEGRDQRVAA